MGTNWNTGKFHFNIRKSFFPGEGCQKWEWVSLRDLLQLTLLQAGAWIRQSPEVPAHLIHGRSETSWLSAQSL